MEITTITFNYHGFKGFVPFLDNLIDGCGILCIQELMITKQDCYLTS